MPELQELVDISYSTYFWMTVVGDFVQLVAICMTIVYLTRTLMCSQYVALPKMLAVQLLLLLISFILFNINNIW